MKKILILEDNLLMLMHLKNIVQEIDERNTIYAYDNVKDAYQCTLEKKIDLFLLDIILKSRQQGDVSGLVFADSIRKVEYYNFTPIIFVTSLEDAGAYTYKNLHCYSFIEKPFDVLRMKQVIEQALRFPGYQKPEKTLYFRKDGVILAVEQSDFVYAESIDRMMHIHTRHRDILTVPYITLKRLVEEADNPRILQCSRSAVVNQKYVQNIDIPNRMIQLRDGFGRVEIGIMFKKYMKECFR